MQYSLRLRWATDRKQVQDDRKPHVDLYPAHFQRYAMKKTILILAANPQDAARLRLDREVREIQERLQGSRYRNRFKLEQRWAVQPRNVQEAILEVKPQIVHFSGHGEGEAGLVFQDQKGQMKLVSSEALSRLFKLCADRVECVVLNACYAEAQANAIVQHISYVIGMRQAIRDDAAIAFSAGFYTGLGEGLSVEGAFEQGKQEIQAMFSRDGIERKLVLVSPVEGAIPTVLPDHLIPILKKKSA
nr:CHAT domain-containing protein [Leptolyngbya ohadii]